MAENNAHQWVNINCCGRVFCYNCKRHWSDWANQRFSELLPALSNTLVWYAARFDYPKVYDEASSDWFNKLTYNIKYKLRQSNFVWVNHLDQVFLHRHYLFGYPHVIDTDVIKKCHEKLCKKLVGYWEPYMCYVQGAISPPGYLRYILGIDYKRNINQKMPWCNEDGSGILLPNVCDGSMMYRHNEFIRKRKPRVLETLGFSHEQR